MKNVLLSAAIICAFPVVASAAWWNPLTWGSTGYQVAENVVVATSTTEERIVQVPVDRVITKTITIDNPALQAQINALLQENATLKTTIATLTQQNAGYVSKINQLQATNVIAPLLSPACQSLQDDINAQKSMADAAMSKEQSDIDFWNSKFAGSDDQASLTYNLDQVKRTGTAKIDATVKQIAQLNTKFTALCK